MQFAQIIPSAPALSIVNGHPTTLSTQVAEYFEKLHKDVLKATRNLIESAPELNGQNFAPVEIKDRGVKTSLQDGQEGLCSAVNGLHW